MGSCSIPTGLTKNPVESLALVTRGRRFGSWKALVLTSSWPQLPALNHTYGFIVLVHSLVCFYKRSATQFCKYHKGTIAIHRLQQDVESDSTCYGESGAPRKPQNRQQKESQANKTHIANEMSPEPAGRNSGGLSGTAR